MRAGPTATMNTERPFHLQQTWTPHLRSTRKAGDRIRDDDQARSDVAIAKFMAITTSTSYKRKEQRPTTVHGTPRTVPRGIHGHIEDIA